MFLKLLRDFNTLSIFTFSSFILITISARSTVVNRLFMETIALRTYELETNNIHLSTELDSELLQTIADGGQL